MKKSEFLSELREHLSFELPERLVKKNIDFYSSYISEETAKGKTEQEVLEELGDAQLIARSVIDAEKAGADGIPGNGDDVDFREEIYGSGKQSAPEVDEKGRTTARAGENTRSSETVRQGDPRSKNPVKSREFGCGGCLIACLIAAGVSSLLMSLLSYIDPTITLLIVLGIGLALLFRKGR